MHAIEWLDMDAHLLAVLGVFLVYAFAWRIWTAWLDRPRRRKDGDQ